MKNETKNELGFSAIEMLLVVLTLLIIGVAGYLVAKHVDGKKTVPTVSTSSKSSTPSIATNSGTELKLFTSKAQGFTLSYPSSWTVSNTTSGNCGFTVAPTCRERFEFQGPVIAMSYAIYQPDSSNDKIPCGTQSECLIDNVRSVQPITIKGLGSVLLVELNSTSDTTANATDSPEVCLDKPVSPATTPTVGNDSFSNYSIDYSLPVQPAGGGRFDLCLHNKPGGKLTADQFFALSSLAQDENILRSLSY